jgi:D-glycero-alpha-D-manno-heptose-7-phosphate kinase
VIISRTPFRISFLGGGTDYPGWYRQHGGQVLSTTIDKYCYITCRHLPPFLEYRYRIAYSKVETCERIDQISHPAVRAVLQQLQIERGVEIHHDADLPARSGMGSSSSFTVGLLHALHALNGRMIGRRQLAAEGIHVEQEVLKETVGSQDQVIAAYGGLNHIVFHANDDITVNPITIPKERVRELNAHLMLFYTGIKRTASDVAASYVGNLEEKRRQLRILSSFVDEGIAILNGKAGIRSFGDLLHEGWEIKRSLGANVANPDVDRIYSQARGAGALGGKVTGAGGGGFFLLFVPPERQEAVRLALDHLINVPFQFDFSGSQIIFCDPETDYQAEERTRAGQPLQGFRELDTPSRPTPGTP